MEKAIIMALIGLTIGTVIATVILLILIGTHTLFRGWFVEYLLLPSYAYYDTRGSPWRCVTRRTMRMIKISYLTARRWISRLVKRGQAWVFHTRTLKMTDQSRLTRYLGKQEVWLSCSLKTLELKQRENGYINVFAGDTFQTVKSRDLTITPVHGQEYWNTHE